MWSPLDGSSTNSGCGPSTARSRSSKRSNCPRTCVDVARVGVTFSLPPGFDDLTWFGLGPGDSYPDRRAAVTLGRWQATVRAQVVPFVVPQEFGLHMDTRWLSLADGEMVLTVLPARPMAASALPYTTDDLAAATHPHELTVRPETTVHLDVAHRGLGTAACGPDTADRWRIAPGTHRWRWSIHERTAPLSDEPTASRSGRR